MAHGKSISKLVVTGLVAGASCFANGDHFPKLYGNERLMRSFEESSISSSVAANGVQRFQRVIPLVGLRGGNGASSTTVGPLYGEQQGSSTGTTAVSTSKTVASYYLIWSQGFLPKFGLMTASLLGLHWAGIAGRMGVALSQGWHTHLSGPLQTVLASTVPNVLLPLLSSSCCLLQLIINALVGAGGCAGFNTLLGPVRPMFLSLLAYLTWSARPPFKEGMIRLSLALLPEMVHLWNQWRIVNWQRKGDKKMESGAFLVTVEVEIPTMGCVACVNKIDTSLRQSAPDKIVDASSWIDAEKEKGGRAKVRLALESREELDSVNALILKSIDGAGFSGSSIVDSKVEDNK
jgi:hypothetical protein